MNDFPVMNVLDSQTELCEPVEDLIFAEVRAFSVFKFLAEVSTIGIVHDDTESAILNVSLNAFDDVWMIECL